MDCRTITLKYNRIPTLSELLGMSKELDANHLIFETNGYTFLYSTCIGIGVDLHKWAKKRVDFTIVDDQLNQEFRDEFWFIIHGPTRQRLREVYNVDEFRDFIGGSHIKFLLGL